MLCATVVVIAVTFLSPIAHIGMFVALAFSFVGGMLEPRRGWMLALLQTLCIVGFYWLNESTQWIIPADKEATFFATHVVVFITLVGSFMGAFIKRI